jgi:hypothetical protein
MGICPDSKRFFALRGALTTIFGPDNLHLALIRESVGES